MNSHVKWKTKKYRHDFTYEDRVGKDGVCQTGKVFVGGVRGSIHTRP